MSIEWTTALTARVDVRGKAALTRSLVFREEDPPRDVWRSAGLVAAALVNRAASEDTAAPPPPPPPPPIPRKLLPRLWLNGGALVGSGLESGPASFGGALRGGYWLPVPLFVGASGGYATASRGPAGLRGTLTTFSLDAGTMFTLSELVLRPRLELVLERVVAETAGSAAAGTSGSRQLAGAGAGVELGWPASEPIRLVGGAEGIFLSSGTAVRVGETRVSAFPALSYRFFLGIEATVLR